MTELNGAIFHRAFRRNYQELIRNRSGLVPRRRQYAVDRKPPAGEIARRLRGRGRGSGSQNESRNPDYMQGMLRHGSNVTTSPRRYRHHPVRHAAAQADSAVQVFPRRNGP
jgi:hypothetical protein